MQLSFGSGAIWGERTDVMGSGIGPRQFGVLQDIQIDFDWSDKELYGQLQFPVAIARGQGKITGKAKFAQILGLLYSDIFFGVTPATGQFAVSQLEAATVPATTPYTVIPANAASYNDDLGISYAATGKRFNRVSTPSTACSLLRPPRDAASATPGRRDPSRQHFAAALAGQTAHRKRCRSAAPAAPGSRRGACSFRHRDAACHQMRIQ